MSYNKRKRKKFEDFIMLGRDMLHSEAWRQLSPSAKMLYIHIKAKHNGSNNGEICLHYSEAKNIRGLGSPSTISKAFRELETGGWIKRTRFGGIYRIPNVYGMTGRYDYHIADPRLTAPGKYKEPAVIGVEKCSPVLQDQNNIRDGSGEQPSPPEAQIPDIEAPDSVSRS